MTTYGGLPDPDWYLDNVLIHAEPGGSRAAVGEASPLSTTIEWTRSWQATAAELRRRCDPAIGLALTQGFVVGTDQLAGLGREPHRLRRDIRRGEWAAIARAVASPVVLATAARGDPNRFDIARRHHALAAAGAALSRRDHVVSVRSGAILHGLPTLAVPALPQVTTRSPAVLGRRRGAHVLGAALTPQDETLWFGAPVTTVARTVVDLARHDRRDGLMAADAAMYSRLLDAGTLAAAIDRSARWPGVRQAREVLALVIDKAESPLESLTRLALHDSGFPSPRPQMIIPDPARERWYRVDLCWPEQRLILEADGRVKYRDDAQLWAEKRRETRLRALGYRVERVLWDDVLRYWPDTRDRLWRELFAGRSYPA